MFQFKLTSFSALVCIFLLVCLYDRTSAQQKKTANKPKPKAPIAKAAMVQPLTVDSGVNIGYFKVKKQNITGAIALASENKFKGLPSISIDALLQGQIAGMQVTNVSGAPGSGTLISIRGASTLNGGSMPLYIVDGIPIKTYRFMNALAKNADNNPLADINPFDIASVTVLKDAQATALYGMRAANGVIVINTSGGTAGKTYLDFSGYTGLMNAPTQRSVFNADEYKSYILDKERSRGQTQQDIANGVGRYLLISTPQSQIERYNNNTNWQDEVLRTGYLNNYHLKLRGGDAIARYSLNVGYTSQSGVLSKSSYDRFTTRFNLDYRVNKKLTILNTIAYTRTDKDLQDEGNAIATNPLYLATLKSPTLAIWRQDLSGRDLNGLDSVDYVGRNNPYAVANRLKNENSTNHILGSITGQYVISKYLTLSATIAADYIRLNETRFRPGEGFAPEKDIIRSAAENNSSETMVANENILTFNKFYGNHSVNILVGNAFQSTEQRNEFAQAINSPSDEFTSISATDPQLLDSISSYEPSWKLMSFFTSLNYVFKGKYVFTANLRADGSSRFAKGKRWGYFPSIGAAWNISSESFLKKNKTINELRLRTSYGYTGNQEVGYFGSYNALVPAIYKSQPGVRLGFIGNPDFTWEKTTQFNAGIDLTMFKRIAVNADFYVKETHDLLNYISLPGISGFSNYIVNDGRVRNTGVELNISGKILTRKLGWQTTFTAAYNKNKILQYPKSQDPIGNYNGYQTYTGIGSAIGAFYGYSALGVYPNSSDVKVKNGADDANPFRGGDIIFEDLDKNGIIDQRDRKVIGNSNPDFFGGFANLFSYKKFDLTIFMDYALGREVYNFQRASLEAMSNYDNQSASINTHWRADGDITDMPRILHNDPVGNTRFSTRWMEDGSYLRLKAITIGYNIAARENRKIFKSARILLTAQNLYTFSKYKGYGPEVASITNPVNYSIDYGNVPQLKTFMIGLHLGL